MTIVGPDIHVHRASEPEPANKQAAIREWLADNADRLHDDNSDRDLADIASHQLGWEVLAVNVMTARTSWPKTHPIPPQLEGKVSRRDATKTPKRPKLSPLLPMRNHAGIDYQVAVVSMDWGDDDQTIEVSPPHANELYPLASTMMRIELRDESGDCIWRGVADQGAAIQRDGIDTAGYCYFAPDDLPDAVVDEVRSDIAAWYAKLIAANIKDIKAMLRTGRRQTLTVDVELAKPTTTTVGLPAAWTEADDDDDPESHIEDVTHLHQPEPDDDDDIDEPRSLDEVVRQRAESSPLPPSASTEIVRDFSPAAEPHSADDLTADPKVKRLAAIAAVVAAVDGETDMVLDLIAAVRRIEGDVGAAEIEAVAALLA